MSRPRWKPSEDWAERVHRAWHEMPPAWYAERTYPPGITAAIAAKRLGLAEQVFVLLRAQRRTLQALDIEALADAYKRHLEKERLREALGPSKRNAPSMSRRDRQAVGRIVDRLRPAWDEGAGK